MEEKVPWTEEEMQICWKLRKEDGLSYDQVAAELTRRFGYFVSKGAAQGKLKRMGAPEGMGSIDEAEIAKRDANFESVHARRGIGHTYAEIADGTEKTATGVRKWYNTQCRRRGIRMAESMRPPPNPAKKKAAASPKQPKVAKRSGPSNFVFLTGPGVEVEPVPDVDEGGGVLWKDLPRNGCEWPVNSRHPWRACGEPKTDGAYCGEHHRRACQKVVPQE